jgi:Ca2+-binding EF-hand superfamily protein
MEIFRALDKDNNGYLTENEFNEYFKDDFEEGALDPTVWATVINALNNSRDEGKLNYNDF